MKVKELISQLLDYNMEADVNVIAHCKAFDYSIVFGSSEGVQKKNADIVSLYVDELCTKEEQDKINWHRKQD